MLIRKNTKAFKTILEIFTACQDRADREQLIRLFITKAGNTVHDRINIEGIEDKASLFYELNYQAVMNSLRSSNHQLHESDEAPGVYYFHSTSNKNWHENPFEFDEAVKKEFALLPDLPIVRKKEKVEKTAFPKSKVTAHAPGKKVAEKKSEKVKKETAAAPKRPNQPNYNLKHEIDFDFLDKVIFRQAKLSKKDVLDYYDKIADHILPYLKDRPVSIRLHSDVARTKPFSTVEALQSTGVELPDWLQTTKGTKSKKDGQLLCNDKEHLLFYVNIGCIEFHAGLARTKNLGTPDYLVIFLESSGEGLEKALEILVKSKDIFSGLKLPFHVKTDGTSALHLYISLDGKSDYETSRNVADYLGKLIRIKTKDGASVQGSDDHTYGKVILDYSVNSEGQTLVAPFSLVQGESAVVATPLLMEELEDEIRAEDFTHETIFGRLKEEGDPFVTLNRKKVNATELLKTLEDHYAFLF